MNEADTGALTRQALITRLLAPIVEFRDGEARTALLMFAYSFLAMTAHNIVKPITRSKFIEDLGADNLPYVLLGAGLFVGVVMQLYSRLVGLLPRRWVIPCTGCGMTVLLIAFWLLFRTDTSGLSVRNSSQKAMSNTVIPHPVQGMTQRRGSRPTSRL